MSATAATDRFNDTVDLGNARLTHGRIAYRTDCILEQLLMSNETIPLDEMVDGRGGVRQHWRRLLGVLSDLGHTELLARRRQIALALSDQTGTPVAPESPRKPPLGRVGRDEAFRNGQGGNPDGIICDPVPLILRGQEFAALEAGIIQRARLAEDVLRDVYGDRRLLTDGVLPSPLLWGNRGFLRGGAIEGLPTLPEPMLSFFAVDLVRGQDGTWKVVAERTARANGVGMAWENRRQMARIVPELFSGQDIRRLTTFRDIWQDSLQRLAPSGRDNPGLALLTPGPHCVQWGEHVILARELGCALVEAGDLTVREGELWLKTVRGLRRVDVLLVKQDNDSLDPLELEGHGFNGITGLLDAARSGGVRLVNDPRGAFVEAPGLAHFTPSLSCYFLGEPLLLDGLPSVWLGDAQGAALIDDVLFADSMSGMERWAVASAVDPAKAAIEPAGLSPADRTTFEADIRAAPWRFIAYRIPVSSVAPTIADNGIEPRPVVLRLFAARDGDDWVVLPGGLAKALDSGAIVSPQTVLSGSLTVKDVWVLSDDQVTQRDHPSLVVPPLPIRRAQGDLPSRAADDFFWLGRYLEQLEGAARLLNVVQSHIAGGDLSPRERADLDVLVRQLHVVGVLDDNPPSGYGLSTVIFALANTLNEQGFFGRLLRKVLRLVPELTDRLTREMRDFILHSSNALLAELAIRTPRGDSPRALARMQSITDKLLSYGATLSGFAAENMVRSGGRQFLDLGRRIERSALVLLSCSGILDQPGMHQRGRMEAALRLMLELCDSVITYRSRYFGVVQPAPVLDLLLLDEDNPRGVGYQLAAIRGSLAELVSSSNAPSAQYAASVELSASAIGILDRLSDLVSSVMHAADQDQAASQLSESLRDMHAAVLALSDQIGRRYFSVLASPRLVGIAGDGTVDDSAMETDI